MSAPLRTLFGLHAVTARLRAAPQSIRELYVDAKRADGRTRDLLALAAGKSVRAMAVDADRLDALAGGSARHQGVVARIDGDSRRSVHFDDSHRLVALFFGAMGINEHAKVAVRKV